MDDGDSKNSKKTKTQGYKISLFERRMFNAGFVFQPLWVRCGSIFLDKDNRKYLEGQFRYVLYCGIVFWLLLIAYETLK
jgi:hypothetical protein